MIAIAVLAIGGAVLALIAAPGSMGGGIGDGPQIGPIPVGMFLPLVGIGGVIIGLAWMIRIHRADPEPDQHAWRYRSRDRSRDR